MTEYQYRNYFREERSPAMQKFINLVKIGLVPFMMIGVVFALIAISPTLPAVIASGFASAPLGKILPFVFTTVGLFSILFFKHNGRKMKDEHIESLEGTLRAHREKENLYQFMLGMTDYIDVPQRLKHFYDDNTPVIDKELVGQVIGVSGTGNMLEYFHDDIMIHITAVPSSIMHDEQFLNVLKLAETHIDLILKEPYSIPTLCAYFIPKLVKLESSNLDDKFTEKFNQGVEQIVKKKMNFYKLKGYYSEEEIRFMKWLGSDEDLFYCKDDERLDFAKFRDGK